MLQQIAEECLAELRVVFRLLRKGWMGVFSNFSLRNL